jgi:TonB family protein
MFSTTLQPQRRKTPALLSLVIHTTAVTLLFTVITNPTVQTTVRDLADSMTPLIAPYMPNRGGGGDRSLLRASKGDLPRAALKQFTPPAAVLNNDHPKLMMEPTVILSTEVTLPVLKMAQLGDPTALAGPPSNGRGSSGGIGDGKGGGVGTDEGPGFGPGPGGTMGGSAAQASGGRITLAAVLWKIEPEYSDEARRAKVQGTVVLALEVDAEGKPRNIRVQQGLGLGLDEKAIEAVRRWKFRAGYQNGKPVTTGALVEVNFRLL